MDTKQLRSIVNSRTVYTLAVVALLALVPCELWLSVAGLSRTADEGAHLYSGYEYWKARDYGYNPEHPPLLKLIAAAPLLSLKLNQPQQLPPVPSKVQQYIGGFIFLQSNNADQLLWRSRLAASVFTLLLAGLVFAAAYEMFGRVAALIALALCVFEPNLLAHGALITTDMAATCGIFAAVYAFYRYSKSPGTGRLVVTAIAVGLALLSKFSALILLPVLPLCFVTVWLLERSSRPTSGSTSGPTASRTGSRLAEAWRPAVGWIVCLAIPFVLVWAFYTFRYQARPGTAQLSPTLPVYAAQLGAPWQTHIILSLARWHILPESFLFGLTDVRVFGRIFPSFLLGQLYPSSTKFYFQIVFVIKSTLPFLLLLCALPFLLIGKYRQFRSELVFLLIPVVVYFLFTINAPQNIGVRHILPIFPFLILLAGLAGALLAARSRAGAYVVVVLLLWHAGTSLRAFPDYLPYSNEAFGGPAKTYRVLTDSNVDWGQGLKEVHAYLEKNKITDCWFAPFGANDLRSYGIYCRPLPSGFEKKIGFPMQIVPRDIHGTVLVSALEASGVYWGPGELNPYEQFQQGHPDAMIGNSILVYRGNFDVPLAAAESHAGQVAMLMSQHKLSEALAEAQTAAELAPDSPEIQAILGGVLERIGKSAEADQAFQKAESLARTKDPRNVLQMDKLIATLKPAGAGGTSKVTAFK